MRVRNLVLVSAAALAVSGCAAPIIGALTLSQLSTIAGGVSTITTGKGLADHALSLLTGKDCSITEGILRKDRKICEERGSLATREDFKGIFAYFEKKDQNGEAGDQALTRYALARNEELSQANEEKTANAGTAEVTPASASALDLHLLTSPDDDPTGTDGGNVPAANNEVLAANTMPAVAPVDSSAMQMKLLTYRDEDINGTPRIVSRYVYMMAPIPDSGAETAAAPVTVNAAPVPSAAPTAPMPPAPAVVAAAPAAPTAPVVLQPQTPPKPAAPTVTAVSQVQPAPVTPATPAPMVARVQPAVHYQPPAPAQKVDSPRQPIVYWYLSGR